MPVRGGNIGTGFPRVSIVVPAYNEGESIIRFLDRLLGSVTLPCEALVVYDTEADTTGDYLTSARYTVMPSAP